MGTIIKDTDVVQFENAVVVAGTWKKAEGEPSLTHRTVITGELTGLQLRGILEGSSSLRVQYQNQVLRKGKPALDKGTWAEFLARLSAKVAKVVYVEKTVDQMTPEEATKHMEDLKAKYPEYFKK